MMLRKTALLVVGGGRVTSDLLALLWLQPQVVRIIISKQGWEYQDAFIKSAKALPNCQSVEVLPAVDVYDFNACLSTCRSACADHPSEEWDWTFSITSAPKIAGIAAYELAKEMGISCWHIDSQRESLVSLVKSVEVDKGKFFHLSLPDFMNIQSYTWGTGSGPESGYRETVKKWSSIARELALSPAAQECINIWRAQKKDKNPYPAHLPDHLVQTPLFKNLITEKLVESSKSNSQFWSFSSLSAEAFLVTGDWLEFYLWHETVSAGWIDEAHCLWGCTIQEGGLKKELDLILIHKAQLVIVECKSELKPFKPDHLHKLQAKASIMGGAYVSQIFVTNQPAQGDAYESFKRLADRYHIVVVTAEQLPGVGKILKQEAVSPTFPGR